MGEDVNCRCVDEAVQAELVPSHHQILAIVSEVEEDRARGHGADSIVADVESGRETGAFP
jgi:hypothetical protein